MGSKLFGFIEQICPLVILKINRTRWGTCVPVQTLEEQLGFPWAVLSYSQGYWSSPRVTQLGVEDYELGLRDSLVCLFILHSWDQNMWSLKSWFSLCLDITNWQNRLPVLIAIKLQWTDSWAREISTEPWESPSGEIQGNTKKPALSFWSGTDVQAARIMDAKWRLDSLWSEWSYNPGKHSCW